MMGIGAVEWALILPIVGTFLFAALGAAFLIGVATLRRSEQPQAMPSVTPCPQCKSFIPPEKRSCRAYGAPLT